MQGAVRAGDGDRERVALILRDHCADGRLTPEELDERLERVYGARTRQELARLTADLPGPEPRAAATGRRRLFWPGVAAFHERRHLRAGCTSAFEQSLREMVPRMALRGFHLIDDVPPRRLVFADGTGLRVTVMFHPLADGGTEVSAFGEAQRAVRKAFATLGD